MEKTEEVEESSRTSRFSNKSKRSTGSIGSENGEKVYQRSLNIFRPNLIRTGSIVTLEPGSAGLVSKEMNQNLIEMQRDTQDSWIDSI
jgi:hypothetical protein